MARNHRWGERVAEERLTRRTCVHCGLVRLTIHEGFPPETAFERNGVRSTGPTPPCIVYAPAESL